MLPFHNKGISFKLNIFHLSNFLTVVLLLLMVNYFAVRKLLLIEVEKNLTTSGKFLYTHLENTKRDVELTAKRINAYFYKNDNYEVFTPISEQLKRIITHVSDVKLVEVDGSECHLLYQYKFQKSQSVVQNFDSMKVLSFLNNDLPEQWTESFDDNQRDPGIVYYSRVQAHRVLIIHFNVNYIISYFAGFDLDKGGFPIIFNDRKQLIYHPLINTHYHESLKNIPEKMLAMVPNKFIHGKLFSRINGHIIKKINLHSDNEPYISYIMFEPNWGWFISVNQPYSQVYSDLFHYIKSVGIWFILAMLLMSYLVITTNFFLTKSLHDIMMLLLDSKYLQLKISPHENEASVIRRGIDLFQNQLDQYSKSIEKNAIDKKKIEHELEMAKKLQRNILPAPSTQTIGSNRFEIFAISESAFDIGGDLYDYFFLDDQHLLFAVGDVSGKGIQASLFMIFTQTLLRSQARMNLSAGEIVCQLNDKLIEENISDLFVTLFIGIVNIETGELNFCNAGHCIPILVHPQGQLTDISTIHGIPTGIYANRKYTDSTIILEKDDMLIVYTDGVVDAKDENGMRFSEDVLKYNLMGSWFLNAQDTVKKIRESIDWFKGNASPEDDLTLLAFKYINRADDDLI